jgi:hypothetical protein
VEPVDGARRARENERHPIAAADVLELVNQCLAQVHSRPIRRLGGQSDRRPKQTGCNGRREICAEEHVDSAMTDTNALRKAVH